ncbi:radical SAM protein [Clostridium sp. MSJ-4]|uniref:Radical SAM protein n=1 Tax=Clostridium simiarum TaxID=2841506 RepID=A0ABS6F010_9CLOT|nr:radical SAM protein [Clostridium simiarum]MBU5591839.1 radical SAM protein [Clostridium simiarum]
MMDTDTSNIYSEIYDLAEKNNTLVNVIIELLTKCNWKCKHCYIPSHDNEGISKEVLFDMFTQLRQLPCFDLTLTGGEIFYRKDIMDIIRKAREMNFNLTLLTNVSLLDEEKIKELAHLYINQISCTIFSLDENIHDSITEIPGSLKKALNNIMLIKKYGIPLEIKTIVMKQNYNSFKDVEIFCSENGFQFKVDAEIFSKNNGDSAPHQLKMSENQLQEVLVDIDKMRGFSIHKHSANEPICPIIKSSISINSNGDVYPCNKYFYKIGNIYDNSINHIWNDNSLLNKIKNLQWKDLLKCFECENNEYCSRCPGVALLEDGNLLGKSSLACEFANVRYKLYSSNS